MKTNRAALTGFRRRLALLFPLVAALAAPVHADPFPPTWDGGSGAAVEYSPAQWPAEPANPADCGADCGEWKPYSRFQNSLNDPRVQDPSNGGTSPQNYVNIASSCIDKELPSIYYNLTQVDPGDPSKDVIMFRWRVEQIANTYATGPNAGSYGSTDPWNSALWTVLFDVDGSGYRNLAAHLNGSSGRPGEAIDMLAGIYGRLPTQSISYEDDPDNIKLLAHNPTAFVDGSGTILNFQGNVDPVTSWPNGSAETVWDYGTSRAVKVSTRSCTEYFVDYQIPVAMLDATAEGGPKVDRSTPISMLFCTANSLNNPFQKDCALDRTWLADPTKPAPFGDYISFDQEAPYSQPIIREVKAQAPGTCAETYALEASVQDTAAVVGGEVVPSVQAVSFWYYYDANGDGVSNDGGDWSHATDAALVGGTLNTWSAAWDSSALPKGRYLIGVQALDDNTLVDDGMSPSGIDNRTFSYVTSDSHGQVYVDGGWLINTADFPTHSPSMNPTAGENWYGNPAITGVQVATAGVDLAINACGVSPAIGKTVSVGEVAVGDTVTYTISIDNPATNSGPITVSEISDVLPGDFSYQVASTNGDFGTAEPAQSGQSLTWTFSPAVSIAAGASKSLSFDAVAGTVAGTYNNVASASTSFGSIESDPVPVNVDAARISLTKTPDSYLVSPSDTLVYTLDYSNDSAVSVTGATLSDTLPAGVTYSSCSGGNSCSESDGTVTWNVGTLTGGAGGSVTLTVSIDAGYSTTSLHNSATLEGTAPAGPVSTSADSSIAVNVPAPAFSLTKSGVATSPANSSTRVDPGADVTWTLTYTNYGTGTASGVVLTDTLPAGFTYSASSNGGSHSNGVVTWSLGSVAAGASASVTVTATAAASPFTFPNPVLNEAAITWDGDATGVTATNEIGVTGDSCSAVYYFHGPTTARTATQTAPTASDSDLSESPGAVTLVFPATAPTGGLSVGGQTLRVSFYMAASTGNATFQVQLWNVTQNDEIAASAAQGVTNSGGVPVLQEFTATIPGGTTIAEGDQLEWRFTLGGSGQLPSFWYNSTTYNSRSSFCDATGPASLALTKTVDQPSIASAGGTLNYVLTYANTGGTTANGVTLDDTFPANVTCAQYTATCGDWADVPGSCSAWAGCSGGTLNLLGGTTLAAGESGRYAVQANVGGTASGTLTNTATLSGTGLATATATASTLVGTPGAGGGTPELVLSKFADATLLNAGDSVTYTLRVVNTGTGEATGVTVSDDFPEQGWFSYGSCTTASGSCNQSLGTLSWDVGTLAAGASATATFTMDVAASGVPAGISTLDNSAIVTDDDYCTGGTPPAGCTSETVTVTVSGNPLLSLSKSANPVSGLVPGDTVTWTLTLRNDGSAAAADVRVTDPIIAGTQFVSSSDGSFDAVGNRVVFDIASLASGEQRQLQFVSRIGTLDAGPSTLTNIAGASAGNAPSVEAQTSVAASAEPVLEVVKSGPVAVPFPAARLAAEASAATELALDSAALVAVNDYLLVGGDMVRVTAKAGDSITVDAPVTAADGSDLLLGARYSLAYSNSGDAAATGVTLSDTLPAGWLFAAAGDNPDGSAPVAPAVGDNGTVQWDLGDLAPGTSGSVQLIAVATNTGTATNIATLGDGYYCTGGSLPAGCEDAFDTSVGGLTVHKQTSTPLLEVFPSGAIAEYSITLTNSLGSEITGVEVSDALPSGFTYFAGSGSPAPTSVSSDGHPTWSGLTVPADGTLTISFQAEVSADTGSATYDNAVSVSAPAGITPFDHLATPDEDVTVVGAGSYLLKGYVFRDHGTLGSFDAGDQGLGPVWVEINDDPNLEPYVAYTDGFGYFQRLLPAGNWEVSVAATNPNPTILDGLSLHTGYNDPEPVTLGSGAVAPVLFGYVPAGSVSAPDVFTTIDLPAEAGTGATVSAILTFGNIGDVTAEGVTYRVNGLPTGLPGVDCSGATCDYEPASGSVVLTGLPGALSPKQQVQVQLGFAAPASGSVTVTSVVATTTAGDPTANNSDSDAVSVVASPGGEVTTTVSAPASAAPGEPVAVAVRYVNIGSVSATGMSYALTGLPGGAQVNYAGQPCTVGAGGALSGCGLPATLAAGEEVQVSVSYSAPGSGTVTITTEVDAGNDTDSGNNQDSASTLIQSPTLADVTTTVAPPASATAGDTVVVPVTYANLGPAAASGVGYSLLLTPGLADVACVSVVCSYDAGSGAVTLSGLPTSLEAGDEVGFTVSYTAPTTGPVTVLSEVTTTTAEVTRANNSATALTVLADAPRGLLQLVKTAYLGQDAGAGCPGSKELVYVDKERNPIDITWCFIATNTGEAWLASPVFTDAGLGVAPGNQAGMQLRSGSFPLAPGATAVWYYEETRDSSLENFASLSMSVVEENGTPVPNTDPVLGEDSVAALFAYVYDPPFGVKTGQVNGVDLVRWTMVWVNDNVVVAEDVLIADPPPEGMTMHGAPVCTPYGITTVDVCTYDPPSPEHPRGRVRVQADFGPDYGVTLGNVGEAPNRLEIAFDVTVDDPRGQSEYFNQGEAEWTPPEASEPFVAYTYDQSQLEGLDPDTPPSEVDPEIVPPTSSPVVVSPAAIPTLSLWSLALLMFGIASLAAAQRRRRPF